MNVRRMGPPGIEPGRKEQVEEGNKNLPVSIRPLEVADGGRRNTKFAAAHSLSLTVLRSHG